LVNLVTRIELPLISDPSVEKNHSVPPVVSPCICAGGIPRNVNAGGVEMKKLRVPDRAAALSIEATVAAPPPPLKSLYERKIPSLLKPSFA